MLGLSLYRKKQLTVSHQSPTPCDDKLDVPVAFLALCPYFIVNPLSEHVHLSYLAVIFRHHNILLPNCYSRIQFLINFHILQFSRSLWASIIAYSILITVLQTSTLNAPIATKVACFSRLLKYLRSLYGKQWGPRSDCSYRSSLFWVHAVCLYT